MSNAILNNSKFIHIPKCGGTSIQGALWKIGCITDFNQTFVGCPIHHGHLFASQMPEDNKPCFTFVRNPITWWLSFYHWNKSQDSRFINQEKETTTFDQWLDGYGQLWLGTYSKIVKRYLGEDENFPTKNKVKYIGKIENLYPDLKNILDECGENYKKNRLQDIIDQNPIDNFQKYERDSISENSKKIIFATEFEIFSRFNYTIEGF